MCCYQVCDHFVGRTGERGGISGLARCSIHDFNSISSENILENAPVGGGRRGMWITLAASGQLATMRSQQLAVASERDCSLSAYRGLNDVEYSQSSDGPTSDVPVRASA